MINVTKEKTIIQNTIIIPSDGVAIVMGKDSNVEVNNNFISGQFKKHYQLYFADTFWKKAKFCFYLLFTKKLDESNLKAGIQVN